MEKVLSDKFIMWIIIIVFSLFISTIFLIRSNTKVAFNEEIANQILYFPNKKMTKIFKKDSENEGFTHIVDKIKDSKIQIKQVDLLTRVVMVYDVSDDFVKLIYTKEVGTEEFKEDYIDELIPNREDIILMSPIEVGTNWSDGDGGIYEIIKTNAIVNIPAGTFETVIVKYTNKDFTVKEYYAMNVGLVKIVVNNFSVYELVQITD